MLDRTTEFIAIHKDRYVFPVKLTVTHLSGAGEDSMFMGMIEVRWNECVMHERRKDDDEASSLRLLRSLRPPHHR